MPSSESHAVLCPGQGAQRMGMGESWWSASPVAASVFDAAESHLRSIWGDRLGVPLRSLCSSGPEGTLHRTDVAQVAIFTVSVASWRALSASGGLPGSMVACAGLSLGEYTALHVSGAIGFEACLELVALRGRAMQDAAASSDGSMVAFIGADEPQARALCAAATEGESSLLVPANFNAPGQIVCSGHATACARAESIAKDRGFRATRLSVAGAFHSPLMAPAAARLSSALADVEIAAPSCPVLSNVTGLPHVSDASAVRAGLVRQLTEPVRWDECCRWLVSERSGAALHELAPGKVLSGLMRRIERGARVSPHDEPAGAGAA